MNPRAAPSFNLIEEPWLPVSLVEGGSAEWGLRELFARAHEARGLSEPSPLTYTAVLRMLLALLHRSLDGPRNPNHWCDLYLAGQFDAGMINDYLERWNDRFDLFHPERPFAQVDASVEMTDNSPVTRMLMERTSGNNPTLFDHSWDENPPAFSPGEAARALLTTHAYAFAGSGGRFVQAPMVAGYAVSFEGRNLFETLMLNLVWYDDDFLRPQMLAASGDAPWWEWVEEAPLSKAPMRPRGLTDLLTWRGRAIRLLPEADGKVRRIQYSQGYVLDDADLILRDPFKRYVRATTGASAGASFPRNFTVGRALWRDAHSLVEHADRLTPTSDQENEPPAVMTWLAFATRQLPRDRYPQPSIIATGLVNNQARIDLWRMDRLPLPLTILHSPANKEKVGIAINRADQVRDALFQAGSTYALQSLMIDEKKPERGGPDGSDITRVRTAMKLDERYWARLDSRFQQFLSDFDDHGSEEALESWLGDLEVIARSVFTAAIEERAGRSLHWKGAAKGEARLGVALSRLDLQPTQKGLAV